ncbi:hypothetical protein N8524_07370 [Candidatus Puniceispirillum sp.]|nr:hypothetical protein [Candidatus Puniceispirillum sp.]
MDIFSGLSGMIETARAKAAPDGALSSSRKLIPLENVVGSSPDLSLAATDPLLRHRQNGDNIGYLTDIIDISEVVMSPSAVPSKMYLQDADRSDQAEKSAKTPASPQQSPQPKPSGEAGQSNQNQPSSQSHDDLKSSLRQRLYAKIDHWLDENMADFGEDALQATPQSRTKPVDKPE